MSISAEDYKLASGDGGVDRAWYLQKYPEVATAGVDPVEHYLLYGRAEGRDPRPDFSTSGYLDANTAIEGNPLVHYLRHGGKKVPPPEWQFAEDYRLAGGDGGVDRAWYLQKYPEVATAGVDPVEHYLRYGRSERRDPRPDFSTSGYLVANKEIEGNPLVHYLKRRMHNADLEETAVTDWYRLWEKGYLYPKGGQQPPANAAFGTPGIPKILFTGHEASRTGAPLILLRLMQAMQSLTGAELFLILERGGAMLGDYVQIAHVLVNHNGMLYLPNGPDLAQMLGSIAGPAPTLAICNSADGWRLTQALRKAGLPHIVMHYAPDVWRTIHRCSNRVVFPADAVKAATTAVLPDFHDASVAPQGLLDPKFGRRDRNAARVEVRSKLGLAPDTAIVLGCGTRDLRKGIDLFIQLAARVCAHATRRVHFVWLGAEQYGAYFERFIELDISQLNLSSIITLVGEVTDPEPYFLAADAFALTSRDDPFPCVTHEAMACALPIVVFDGAGGAKEAIASDCGIVVPYLDVPAMADALVAFVDNPAQFADMGKRAETRVRSTYRFLDYAEQIRHLCDDIRTQVSEPEQVRSVDDTRSRSEDSRVEARSERNQRMGIKQWFLALPGNIGRMIRAEQWWAYKLAPMYTVFYATAYLQSTSIVTIWPAAITLLLAIAPCAAYVSLINDVTDREDDRRAGKTNRMADRPLLQIALLLAAPLFIAAIFSMTWRDDVPLVAVYLSAWVAFSLYSIPPFRLKSRGVLGVFADACGSHVFPSLTAALLALRAAGKPDPVWIATLAVWALGCGVRGILWHQLYDFDADRKAAVQTFVVRHSRLAAVRLARAAFFVESLALAGLLWQTRSAWPAVFLSIYAVYVSLKARLWGMTIVIAEPRDRYTILGLEYYTALFPLGILLACALRSPGDWTFVVSHLIVFGAPVVSFMREGRLLAQTVLRSGIGARG